MMIHTISMIPYANMAPYRFLGTPEGCRWASFTPRQSTQALIEGKVLAAALPVGDLPVVEHVVEPLGTYGIAATGAVKSVLLFSNRPFESMASPARIRLTGQSSTSVRLLYLLAGYQVGFDRIPYAVQGEPFDGELLIGDDALIKAKNEKNLYITDLAAQWYAVHKLPFVFARWVIRKDAPVEVREALEAWLGQLRDRDDELVRASAPAEAQRLGISTEEMVGYLKCMRRVFGPGELEGQKLFLEELDRYGRDPLFLRPQETTEMYDKSSPRR